MAELGRSLRPLCSRGPMETRWTLEGYLCLHCAFAEGGKLNVSKTGTLTAAPNGGN